MLGTETAELNLHIIVDMNAIWVCYENFKDNKQPLHNFKIFTFWQLLIKKHHMYKLAANTISLFNFVIASVNLISRSVLPIFLDAWHSCLSTSSNLRIHLIMEPGTK